MRDALSEGLRCVRLHDVPPTPWRNGGGRTRELLAWPSALDWAVRISVAAIGRDGPFSPFEGVARCFAVIDGAGVELAFGMRLARCGPAGPVLSFDGADAPFCRLLDGPTADLNLMVRQPSGRGMLRRCADGDAGLPPHALRAVYCADACVLHADATRHALPAGILAWSDDAADRSTWQLGRTADARAWWLCADVGSVQ